MDNSLKRYQLFGWDYDHYSPLNGFEVDWHKSYAEKTGSPILELACGTGRLISKLAEVGFDVAGIDLSDKMLEIADKNINKLPDAAKSRITLIKGDITSFAFDQQFGLIFIADNSFRELRTKDAQVSCLKAVYKHLSPNGIFLLTVRHFDFSSFINGKREITWSKPIIDPTNGHKVSRKIKFTLSPDNKQMNGIYCYKIVDTTGSEYFEECSFAYPILQEEDFFAMLVETGFKALLFHDFDNQKGIPGQTMCFVCTK